MQMAIDRWLLEQHQSGHPPTLRFYTWSPPAISLGYHQHKYPEHWQHLVWQGEKVDLVRRPTGGRAVLHQGDLTYAVVTSGLIGTRVQVYEKICSFLIQGWRSLGIELHYGTVGRGYIHNPNCFGTATGADLVLPDGTKFIGSAQLRRGGTILQHGSIRLHPDAELFTQVFGTESFTPVQLSQKLDTEKIIAALITAAEDCFDMHLEVQPLSQFEWETILAQQSLETG
ncbi:biotin/lipoate A/B protein ligase [Scytonema sp. HK-05]|uniref:lipoate--protein ligase family protein n=1 Tax=Scytonema sp. HK-05 TaxID=1137095 RepID=UPI0009FA2ABE|nr:biotin/lipoate A/B protein ligase family protein [Scytonema sp. HK-05]BAY43365.1 biotin/lipoate A/B protein ligase [Scytonema sp. HK-05]